MRLDELQAIWEKDCKVDQSELGSESLRTPELHNKYYKLYMAERTIMRERERELAVLQKAKHEFYLGSISEEELKLRGWIPNPLKILRTDLPIYLDADKELGEMKMKVFYQKEKVDYLEAIIKSFNNRGYHIKNAIDWERFKVGS